VRLIVGSAEGAAIRLQLRGYRITPPREGALGAPVEQAAAGALVEAAEEPAHHRRAIATHLFQTLRGDSNLIFANTRARVEQYADDRRRLCEERGVPNEFWPHHGSLSRELREDVEALLKDRTLPVSVLCTTTLELGIDIGDMKAIAQLGAPPSVASLRQRLG